MQLALLQYSVTPDTGSNLAIATNLMRQAVRQSAKMILFPELCLNPFFPQYEGRDASPFALGIESKEVRSLQACARDLGVYAVPNVYLDIAGQRFDASIMIAPDGEIKGISKMVHIAQAPGFFEQDYYTPSDTGFLVYDTVFGCVGIVICFDRHFPESIRTCVLRGAQLILIPTANTMAEPRDMFEWELRVAARQNGVWIAMCNRVGVEGATVFSGESIIVNPEGDTIIKAGQGEQLVCADIDFFCAEAAWQRGIYLDLLRPSQYQTAS